MAKQNKAKALTKRAVKKSLIVAKQSIGKNKTIRKVAVQLRNVLLTNPTVNIYDYSRYAPTIADYQKQLKQQASFKYRPLISIVMPTYNTDIQYLEECIESVLLQSYDNWELCIADDKSPDTNVVKTIKRYQKQDTRIKLVQREKNGHISAATNSAIAIAQGEYVALLDHDDVLWPNALYEVVKVLNDKPESDLIYTDEDKIDSESRVHSYPFFKPDWSPEFLESCNYITHFSTIRKSLLEQLGGLRVGYEGAQDWDLFIRIAEQTNHIVHIPKVLYSWRIHEASTAMDTSAKPYVFAAQKQLLVDHIQRTGRSGEVKQGIIKQHSRIEYAVEGTPQVSIVFYGAATKENLKNITTTLALAGYEKLEVLAALSDVPARGRRLLAEHGIQLIDGNATDTPELCNQAAAQAEGEYLVFVDASMKLATKHWVNLLLGDIQTPGVGVVGGKTLNQTKERFMRAGVGMGVYGLYASMLEFMPAEDVHYMRGLYGQSRRNVCAVDGGCLMLAASTFKKVGGFTKNSGNMLTVDVCLKVLRDGARIVYNPIVQIVDPYNKTAGDLAEERDEQAVQAFKQTWASSIEHDPYFNPNFTRMNAQLDIQ